MSTYDTIVIGAGMSGVTAARMLVDAGRSVLVLEGRDRVGGRMNTDRSAGFPVDLGASWVHGIDDSALWDLVQALDIPTLEYTVGSFQVGGRPIENFADDGTPMDAEASARWIHDVELADRLLTEEIAASATGDTYLDVTERALDRSGFSPQRIDEVREFFRHRVEEQCGAWIGDLDAHGLDEDAIDGDEVIFPRGYDELPRRIAAGLDVRLDTTVTRVSRTADTAVVATADGEEYEARTVIVTVPLGVLKAGTIAFAPPLPDEIAGPIDRLGMGVFNKIFLQFPAKFWGDDSYVLRALGEVGEHWHSWYDVSAVSGIPTLLTFAAGPFGRRMQDLPDDEIVADALGALRRLYPQAADPTARWITRWGQDPFSVGSYSHLAVGSSHRDHDELAGPVGDVLHFAGEATWGDEPATVGAAFYSGRRAAERILGTAVDLAGFAERIRAREQSPGS
ncbi:FAD-dependent oxidoreductase [Microbacterium sp. 1.5R]|uniref:flavin monoamine oxidase family protein n=1 Tax=Microbacterium sp. 1.5R TaxID=1916917 RepID=UPI0011A08E8E|nr:FAD-dependent oxidoreductase [Microbacterium sp. 1.5R]